MKGPIIIKPTNKRLQEFVEKGLGFFNRLEAKEMMEARGEDIPSITEQFVEDKMVAFGLTGEDLFNDYMLSKSCNSRIEIIKRIVWRDEKALFGKPTLCLLGPDGGNPLSKNPRICINAKYKNMALAFLKSKGIKFKPLYVNGQTESCVGKIADLAIDIVYSGSTIRELKLAVYDRIFSSDFVIIGGKNGSKELY
ncbi:MAG: hypothetical protein Q7J54_07670 [Candidatus Woesearchaeota archaeon]|nr:hypothetical protein [Candidatus Woesearchaeota archaeon]